MSQTLPQLIFETAQKFPQKTALLYKKGEAYVGISFQELINRINIFAKGLNKIGVVAGERVALLSKNRPDWVIADLAIMSLGAINVPIHTTLSPKIISYILNHSQAKILIVSGQKQIYKILTVIKELFYLETIIFIDVNLQDFPAVAEKKIFSWEEIMSEGESIKFGIKTKINSDDICSIIYTSGTTGIPKGVMLTHKNFITNIEASAKAVPVHLADVLLSFLPLSHVFERTAGYYTPLAKGATIAYAESPKQLAKNLAEVKPTILISVPRIFEKIHDGIWEKLKQGSNLKMKLFKWALRQEKGTFKYLLADKLIFKKIRNKLGGRFRLTISGGAALNENLARFFNKLGILILEGYGLTETAPVASVNREDKMEIGSVGLPIENVEVKIAEDKEILVKGPNVMKGYYKDEAGTNEVIDNDGWFHTGDLGFRDSEGLLYIIGRKKEMIVTAGGKNIWPQMIENELNNDRFIIQSMVIGHRRPYLTALIVPDWQEVQRYTKEKHITYQSLNDLIKNSEILNLFRQRIDKITLDFPTHEKIKKFTLIKDEFTEEREELTPTLKLRRSVIEKHYQKEIEKMYRPGMDMDNE